MPLMVVESALTTQEAKSIAWVGSSRVLSFHGVRSTGKGEATQVKEPGGGGGMSPALAERQAFRRGASAVTPAASR
jgi:hypothetical protein